MPEKTIRTYILLASLSRSGIAFIASTYAIFLMSRGLDLFEINIVNLVFYATLLLLEVPTGAIADIFGRKLAFVSASILESICMFVYSKSYSFTGFAIAESIGAVGTTLTNGAFQSWLADELKSQNYDKPLVAIFNREQQISTVLAIITSIAGAQLAKIDISSPWSAGSCLQLITAILAIILVHETRTAENKLASIKVVVRKLRQVVPTIHNGICKSLKNESVRFILLMETALFLSIQAPNMQWQPYFSQYLSSTSYLGYIHAGLSISVVIGSLLNRRLIKIAGDEKKAIAIAQLVVAFGIIMAVSKNNFQFSLLFFYVHEVGRGMLRPLRDAYLNNNIDSDTRATVLSVANISHHLGGMTGLFFSGLLAQQGLIPRAWIISGTVLIIATLAIMATTKK